MSYHKSIETIPIANYNKIATTNKLGYMFDASFLECENLKVTPEMVIVWEKMQSEYNEVVAKRRTASDIIELQNELGKLTTDHMIVKMICQQLILGNYSETYEDLLSERNYRVDKDKNLKEQGEIISKRANNYLTRIRLIEDEIKGLSSTGKQNTIEEMVMAINRHMGISIDIYKTSAKQWLAYEDQFIKEMSKKKRK